MSRVALNGDAHCNAEPERHIVITCDLLVRGVGYARYNHSKWPGFGAAWADWVADVEVNRRTGESPLGTGESSSIPDTAAIANAIFDATGVRFRQPPFTPEVVLAGLTEHERQDFKYKNDL